VASFLKGRGLTFPVLLAKEFVDQVRPDGGIPRNWIVVAGVVRSGDVGFRDPEIWTKDILTKIDEARTRR